MAVAIQPGPVSTRGVVAVVHRGSGGKLTAQAAHELIQVCWYHLVQYSARMGVVHFPVHVASAEEDAVCGRK
jgi:hypothetical protein